MIGLFALVLFHIPINPSQLSPILARPAEAAPIDISTSTLQAYASSTAAFYHLDVQAFLKTINCESGFEWSAINTKTNDYGIAQWHPAAHASSTRWDYISKDDALDPYHSIDLMALAWSKGFQHWWVCFNEKGG